MVQRSDRSRRPFTDLEIRSLYGDHATYLQLMAERTDQIVADGFLLPADAVDLMARACRAAVRFGEPASCPAYQPPPFGVPLESGASDPADPAAPAGAPDAPAAPEAPSPVTVAVLPATGRGGQLLLVLAMAIAGAVTGLVTRRSVSRHR